MIQPWLRGVERWGVWHGADGLVPALAQAEDLRGHHDRPFKIVLLRDTNTHIVVDEAEEEAAFQAWQSRVGTLGKMPNLVPKASSQGDRAKGGLTEAARKHGSVGLAAVFATVDELRSEGVASGVTAHGQEDDPDITDLDAQGRSDGAGASGAQTRGRRSAPRLHRSMWGSGAPD